MIHRKALRFSCVTGKPGHYPKGMDPESMSVQIAHDVWRWYMPDITAGAHAEPLIRNWANWTLHCYRMAGDHGRPKFVIETVIGPDNLPLMRVVR